ncbi:hypothetical protein D3C87_1651800 [compost metagenome]
MKADPLADLRIQLMAVGRFNKVAVAIRQVVATECVAAIQCALRELHHAFADVHGVHLKARGGHARIQQGHGNGIRFFAAGARHA